MNSYSMHGSLPLLPVILLAVWVFAWKGYALWTAAKSSQKGWFVALLVLNTFGLLEIIYVFWVAKKKWSDIQKAFVGIITSKKNPKKKESTPTEEVK